MAYKKWLLTISISTLALLAISVVIGKTLIAPIYNPDLFVIDEQYSTVIIGASHSATSFNPEHLSNSKNLAESGEPLFYTYYKLKTLLRLNKHITRIVLSFVSRIFRTVLCFMPADLNLISPVSLYKIWYKISLNG